MKLSTILNAFNQWVWRQRLRRQVAWALSAPTRWFYAETRPVPLLQFKEHVLPITTDCSGFVTGLFYAAKAPDPNGNNYAAGSAEYTGSMLAHLRVIARPSLKYGDLVVFGAAPGVHVVMALGAGANPQVVSHGHAGLDVMTLAEMILGFPDQPATCLSAFTPKGHTVSKS